MADTIVYTVSLLTAAVDAQTAAVVANQAVTVAAQAAALATKNRVDALNNVDNTTDLNKPISTATLAALVGKTGTIKTVNGNSLLGAGDVVVTSSVVLTSVAYENRASIKALSPTTDASMIIEGLGLFQWSVGILEPEDDETCFNTATGQWLLAVPAFDLLEAMALVEESIQLEQNEDEVTRLSAFFVTK